MAGMRYQPQGRLRLDAGNALTLGLRVASLLGVNLAYDAATASLPVAVGTKAVPTVRGLAAGFSTAGVSTADRFTTNVSGDFPVATGRSYFFRARRDSATASGLGRLFDKTSSTTGQYLLWYNSDGRINYGFYSGANVERNVAIPNTGITAAVGAWFDVLVTHTTNGTDSTINAFVNGQQVLTNSVVAGALVDAPGTAYTLGNRASANRTWDGLIECAYIWDRVLTLSDAAALSANPYRLYAAPEEEYEATAVGGHNVLGAASAQTNTAGTGAITQGHNVTGTASAQGNTGATGTVGQEHQLAGSASTQSNLGGTGAIGQTHAPVAASSAQSNTGGTGAISIVSDPRYARPSGTVAAGAWLPSAGASLHAVVDEPSADAADYMYANTPGTAELALNPVTDPQTSSGQVVRYQAWSPAGGGLTVSLKQGAAVIASRTHATLPLEPTVFALVLSAAQCDSITNYADLRFVFEAF